MTKTMDSSLLRYAMSDPVVSDAMQALLDMARRGELPGTAKFMEFLGESVLCVRSADLMRFIVQSEAGKTLLYWLPEGNRQPAGLRDFLIWAGWILTWKSGHLVQWDRTTEPHGLEECLFVRTTRRQDGKDAPE